MSARARVMASRALEAQACAPCGPEPVRRGPGIWRVLLVASALAGGVGLVVHLLSPARPRTPALPEDGDSDDDGDAASQRAVTGEIPGAGSARRAEPGEATTGGPAAPAHEVGSAT